MKVNPSTLRHWAGSKWINYFITIDFGAGNHNNRQIAENAQKTLNFSIKNAINYHP